MAKRTPGEYVRALVTAARMTLRGEQHPAQAAVEKYPQTNAWLAETAAALTAIEQAARAARFDPTSVTMHIEGRDVRMSTILEAVRFHIAEEYPSLLASPSSYSLLALKATNLNDRYLALRLEQADGLPDSVVTAVHTLAEVLSHQPTE
ncbi:MAG TPA: hypothetical protein VER79_11275 [Candidatus Limnocylindrales bacterium]|nr:hypothetical protein [Candidatus Limnocylindrales bacterium]